jgi:peptidoglycan/LPS O-acetylase OafA/YrhL
MPARLLRADIQALRAVAVGLVVMNHFWPTRVTGGYVGVDIFFVISGYLITAHLLKELNRSGGIRLAAFYAKRVRRLLPAAFLVLAASLLGSMLWLPFSRWVDTAQEILASALYSENWLLALKSVDYSAATATATVAQHYWSLSVEEQFYLVWPVMLLGLTAYAARKRLSSHNTVVAGVSIVVALGLVASVVITETSRNQAYFVTPVRAWEFGVGALVYLTARTVKFRPTWATGLSLAGFAVIAVSALTFDKETAFPGWLAIVPVLGTALVLMAGNDERFAPLQGVLGWTPIQYIGNISYSLYLWHWPVLVLAPYALTRPLGTGDKLLLVLGSVLLAALTKTYVEDRGQGSRFLNHSPKRTFAAMALATALMAGLGIVQIQSAGQLETNAKLAYAAAGMRPCYGPAALLPGTDCQDRFGPSETPVLPDNFPWPTECIVPGKDDSRRDCDFSDGRTESDVVWVVGDSHAQHWQAAIFKAARERHWIVKTAYFGGCPVVSEHYQGYDGAGRDPEHARQCMKWSQSITATIAADRPATVFTSAFAREQGVDDGSGNAPSEQFAAQLRATWQHWTDAGSMVYVLADPPLNGGVRAVDCTALHAAAPAECAVDRKAAQPTDPLVVAARDGGNPNVRLLDFTDSFCDIDKCYTAIGGVDVYYDANHMNYQYAELLAPMLLDRIS